MHTISNSLIVLFLLSGVFFLLGLINPKLVPGKSIQTRAKSSKVYGLATIFLFLCALLFIGIFGPGPRNSGAKAESASSAISTKVEAGSQEKKVIQNGTKDSLKDLLNRMRTEQVSSLDQLIIEFDRDPDRATGRKILPKLKCDIYDGVPIREALMPARNDEEVILARELIELARRKDSDKSWRFAQMSFYLDNSDLIKWRNMMEFDRGVLESAVNNNRPELIEFSKLFQMRLKTFKGACEEYLNAVGRLNANYPDLAPLRKEQKKPWLDKSRGIPCEVRQEKGCYK